MFCQVVECRHYKHQMGKIRSAIISYMGLGTGWCHTVNNQTCVLFREVSIPHQTPRSKIGCYYFNSLQSKAIVICWKCNGFPVFFVTVFPKPATNSAALLKPRCLECKQWPARWICHFLIILVLFISRCHHTGPTLAWIAVRLLLYDAIKRREMAFC